jgi:hypothetical protein
MAISFYDRELHGPLAMDNLLIPELSYLALTLFSPDYPDQALRKIEEAVAPAQDIGRPFPLAFAEHFGSFVREFRREGLAGQETAERVIALSAEHGFTFWLAQATSMRGHAMVEQGRNEEAIEQIREGLGAMRAIGMEAAREYHLSCWPRHTGS